MNLHERIAKALKWSVEDCQKFSLPMLREMLRTVNPKLAHEVTCVMQSGAYYVGEPIKRGRA